MDTTMRNLWNLCDQLIHQAEVLSEGNEYRKFCGSEQHLCVYVLAANIISCY